MKRGVITVLRDMVPLRPLTRTEALDLAERQARCLLRLAEVTRGPVPDSVVTDLPRVKVRRIAPFPVSGATHWSAGAWTIALNSSEPVTRQRFSLAHELKHILDHPFVELLYADFDSIERDLFIEQVCDYFAGCLLVPTEWLEAAWQQDTRNPAELAHTFHVSQAAILTRLRQSGLTFAQDRCGRSPGLGFEPTRVIRAQRRRHPSRYSPHRINRRSSP